MSNILIAYFSRTGENYNVGVIDKGNTAVIAEMIKEYTNGDMFEIKTVNQYPDNYMKCIEIAQAEKNTSDRPKLAIDIDTEKYDTIFLGYPNWWGDMPMAVYTFLEKHDFSGKTIIPLCTHEGSGFSGTEQYIQKTCPNSKVKNGFSVEGHNALNSKERVKKWIDGLRFDNE